MRTRTSGRRSLESSDNNAQTSAIRHQQWPEWIHSFSTPAGSKPLPANSERILETNKSTSVLAAAIVSLVIGLGAATSSNAQSPAQSSMSDQAYCHSLVKVLKEGTGTVRGLPVGNATAVAIGQCEEGNPGPAIPVLEQQLRDRDIAVPARG
jgi:hypothetical protein